MKYNINVDDWRDDAILKKAQGYSNRKIAVMLFDNKNYRNRLNTFFKQESVIEDVKKKEKELEIQGEVINSQLQNDYSNLEVKPKHELYGNTKLPDSYKTLVNPMSFGRAVGEGFKQFDKVAQSKQTILVVADTQCKSEEDLEYMLWIGHYIAEKQPDVIVHIGDHYDFPSLSSYDKGKSSAEGKRLVKDIEAGNIGFEYLNIAMQKHKDYTPRKIFCLGNHENRLDRYIDDNPELIGTLGTDFLPFDKYGWEVHPFLKPVEVNGIFFVHYLANPMGGKPYGGNAMNILKTVGRSFVVGHKQILDVAIRPTIDGKQQIGIVNGACYDHVEGYKGWQGNNHFRGLTVLHEAQDGFACPSFVSLDYMKEKYYNE